MCGGSVADLRNEGLLMCLGIDYDFYPGLLCSEGQRVFAETSNSESMMVCSACLTRLKPGCEELATTKAIGTSTEALL